MNKDTKASLEANAKTRRDWYGIKPYTRVIEDKRKANKVKEKGKEMRDNGTL